MRHVKTGKCEINGHTITVYITDKGRSVAKKEEIQKAFGSDDLDMPYTLVMLKPGYTTTGYDMEDVNIFLKTKIEKEKQNAMYASQINECYDDYAFGCPF
jgi:hypothetical protein